MLCVQRVDLSRRKSSFNEVASCFTGCPVAGCGKNRSWCSGWESQQQRRKPRPGSQISSVSSAVFIWPDRLAGATFLRSLTERQLWTSSLCLSTQHNSGSLIMLMRLLWINTSECTKPQANRHVLLYFGAALWIIIVLFLSSFEALCRVPTESKNAFAAQHGCYYLYAYPPITAFGCSLDKRRVGV